MPPADVANADLVAARQAAMRLLATERDLRKKAQAVVSKLASQVAAAGMEQQRWAPKAAAAAACKTRLEAAIDAVVVAKASIEARDTELRFAKHEYKHLEAQLIELGGGMVHQTVAARQNADATQSALRLKSDRKVFLQLQQQEAALEHGVADALARLESLRNHGNNSTSSGDARGVSDSTAAGTTGGAADESLVAVQLEFERRRREQLQCVLDELTLADRELEHKKAELEQRDSKLKASLSSKYAKAEAEREAVVRDQAALKSELNAVTQRAEDLRRRSAHLDREVAQTTESNEKLDLEVLRLQRHHGQITSSLDATLRKGALAVSKTAEKQSNWAAERAQLERDASTLEKRSREVQAEAKRNREEVDRIRKSNPVPAEAAAGQGGDAAGAELAKTRAAAAAARQQAQRLVDDAVEIERRNETSQKEEVIAQLKGQCEAQGRANADLDKENAQLTQKLASVQRSLKEKGLVVA